MWRKSGQAVPPVAESEKPTGAGFSMIPDGDGHSSY
jgi:hypothetical protein